MLSADVLNQAVEIVTGDRNADYGAPGDNHGATAAMWTVYLERRGLLPTGVALTARDVCWLNILQKASRDAHSPKEDNLVDVAGYAQNAGWCVPSTVNTNVNADPTWIVAPAGLAVGESVVEEAT